jgi:hypothetical protein
LKDAPFKIDFPKCGLVPLSAKCCRTLAYDSVNAVMQHWQAHGLKSHIVRGFKVSRGPQFVEKLEDIVGL